MDYYNLSAVILMGKQSFGLLQFKRSNPDGKALAGAYVIYSPNMIKGLILFFDIVLDINKGIHIKVETCTVQCMHIFLQ